MEYGTITKPVNCKTLFIASHHGQHDQVVVGRVASSFLRQVARLLNTSVLEGLSLVFPSWCKRHNSFYNNQERKLITYLIWLLHISATVLHWSVTLYVKSFHIENIWRI